MLLNVVNLFLTCACLKARSAMGQVSLVRPLAQMYWISPWDRGRPTVALTGAVAWTFSNRGSSSLPETWDGKSFQFTTGSALRIRDTGESQCTTETMLMGQGGDCCTPMQYTYSMDCAEEIGTCMLLSPSLSKGKNRHVDRHKCPAFQVFSIPRGSHM